MRALEEMALKAITLNQASRLALAYQSCAHVFDDPQGLREVTGLSAADKAEVFCVVRRIVES
jgi:hypothetical protein